MRNLYQAVPSEGQEADTTADWDRLARRKGRSRVEDVPVRSIILGFVLLVIGLTFYAVCYAHHCGHTRHHIKEGSGWGLFIMGTITFLPGAYATWIAFAAWQGILGFKYSDLPKME